MEYKDKLGQAQQLIEQAKAIVNNKDASQEDRAKVEQMFAEHELQIKEKVLAGVTDTIGELHNGLASEMKGISDKLNQFEVQGATQ